MKQCESRKGRPKILDNAAFAEFRYLYDGKDICILRVLFNESASKSAIRSGKCVVGELLFLVQAPLPSITQLYLVALYFLRLQHKPEIERKRILVTSLLGLFYSPRIVLCYPQLWSLIGTQPRFLAGTTHKISRRCT